MLMRSLPRRIRFLALSLLLPLAQFGGIDLALCQVETGQLAVSTNPGHSSYIESLAVSADQTLLATGAADNLLKVWDIKTRRLLRTLTRKSSAEALSDIEGVSYWLPGRNTTV
jgi:WD40 repeat protein